MKEEEKAKNKQAPNMRILELLNYVKKHNPVLFQNLRSKSEDYKFIDELFQFWSNSKKSENDLCNLCRVLLSARIKDSSNTHLLIGKVLENSIRVRAHQILNFFLKASEEFNIDINTHIDYRNRNLFVLAREKDPQALDMLVAHNFNINYLRKFTNILVQEPYSFSQEELDALFENGPKPSYFLSDEVVETLATKAKEIQDILETSTRKPGKI